MDFLVHNLNLPIKYKLKSISKKESELRQMCSIADKAVEILGDEDASIDDFGRLLHETWRIKKSLSSKISTPAIDKMYETGRSAGALGGKLLGAGSGGFILFYVKPEFQQRVKKALENLIHVPFKFDNHGSHVVHYSPNTDF